MDVITSFLSFRGFYIICYGSYYVSISCNYILFLDDYVDDDNVVILVSIIMLSIAYKREFGLKNECFKLVLYGIEWLEWRSITLIAL